MIDQKLIENFIHNHINLINDNQWDEVYEKLSFRVPDLDYIGAFTEMCLLSNINPLEYMEKVPDYFLFGSTKIDILYIPENTKRLGKLILCKSNVSKVKLHKNVQLNSTAWNGAKPILQIFLNNNYIGNGFH